MVFGHNLKILTLAKKDTRQKHSSRGAYWCKFQLHSTFQRGVKGAQRKASISPWFFGQKMICFLPFLQELVLHFWPACRQCMVCIPRSSQSSSTQSWAPHDTSQLVSTPERGKKPSNYILKCSNTLFVYIASLLFFARYLSSGGSDDRQRHCSYHRAK